TIALGIGVGKYGKLGLSWKRQKKGGKRGIVSWRENGYTEFDNEVQFGAFRDAQGITHNFSAPRTPQSYGVVERKNHTLQEISRTMLNEQSIPQKFWCNAIDTSTYILNRILIRPILEKTPYEIYRDRKPSLEYFKLSPLVDDDVGEEEAIKNNVKVVNNNNIEDESIEVDDVINIKESKNHPLGKAIGSLNLRPLRSQAQIKVERFQTNQDADVKRDQAPKDDEADSVDNTKYQAEYVSAGKACQQALWMKEALIDYDIRLDDVLIMCDNKGAIDLSRDPVQHFRTKHIEIRHHFLHDNVQKGNISINKVTSKDNLTDILTKPSKCEIFNYLRLGLGIMELIMDNDPPYSQK
nr:retrovirus-related Pol polyprotein from transposon TNT 1-94 [Tanacetum cinerariifolium]